VLTPGPPTAVFGPWGFIVSTRYRLTLETLGAEYSFANTLLLTLFCWGGVQFAEHPKARGTTGAKAAPIGNATAIGAPSPRVAGRRGHWDFPVASPPATREPGTPHAHPLAVTVATPPNARACVCVTVACPPVPPSTLAIRRRSHGVERGAGVGPN